VKWLKTTRAQKLLLSGVLFFNLLDIVFTLFFVGAGFAVEANPFMLLALERGEAFFTLIKLLLVSLCVLLLWRLRHHRIAQLSTLFCFLTYFSLVAYHFFGIIISMQL
jgi:hypothetical protein